MKIFLDDERYPPNDGTTWVIIRTYEEFCNHIKRYGCPTFISFDHDLGISYDGYDCAKFLGEAWMNKELDLTGLEAFYVHSQNPVGAHNINIYMANLMEEVLGVR